MMMEQFELAKEIAFKLHAHGYIAYFAGGWVRDFLMKHLNDDIDIATNATPEEIDQIFKKTLKVGAQFGVVVVPFK
ncbi:hypothetical protein ABTM85_20950, partial [Acinetobacter baumannii]